MTQWVHLNNQLLLQSRNQEKATKVEFETYGLFICHDVSQYSKYVFTLE